MTSAHGWVARYTKAELPVLAWVMIELLCEGGPDDPDHGPHLIQSTHGLVMPIGSVDGPVPHFVLSGDEEDQLGKFLGFYPG